MLCFRIVALIPIALVCFCVQLFAEDIRYIKVGQKYYWSGIFSDELVVVTGVDVEGGRVQVTRDDGEVVWLKPSDLITRDESNKQNAVRAGIVIGGIVAALNSGSESKPPARASLGSVTLCNKTTKGRLFAAVTYQDATGWRSRGWFNVDQGDCTTAATDIVSDRVLYFAEDAANNQWGGDIVGCVHPGNAFTLTYSNTCNAPYMGRAFASLSLVTQKAGSVTFVDR